MSKPKTKPARDFGQHPKFAKQREHKIGTLPVKPSPGTAGKPKSAAAKRMDRPHRVAMVERGHAKLMRWFGA